MRTHIGSVPNYLVGLVESLRSLLHDEAFLDRHRVRPQDFTRRRQLTFPLMLLFILQHTVKSLQRHLHEFLDELALGAAFEPVTGGAVSPARAKLKASAFVELNQQGMLPVAYGSERPVRRWRGHRLLGLDSTLLRLPDSPPLRQAFGCQEAINQHGATGTRFPQARLSVVYDLLNRIGHQARLEPSSVGEVALAIDQIQQGDSLQPGDIVGTDRGFSGYLFLAEVRRQGLHFIGRCWAGSFGAAQELFRRNRAPCSQLVWWFCPPDQRAECRQRGLPLKMQVRFVSVRLPNGQLEVLAISLLDPRLYPTEEFAEVYHTRWGQETFHLMLKGRLEVERFSGWTVEAVHQDVQAAVLLANLESLLTEPVQAALEAPGRSGRPPGRVNRANAYHAIKDQVLDLLYGDLPAQQVLPQLMSLFAMGAVAVRPRRRWPRRRRPSLHRSYHFQRRVKKVVF